MRTLMEKARTMFIASSVNKEFWGEAMYTAAYVTNRSPRFDSDKTPYEMWNQRKPNLKYLQIFGCEAWVKTLTHVKKLDKRSKKYVFMGYASMAYRLWDQENRRIIVSREVIFRRNFPGQENSIQADSMPMIQEFADSETDDTASEANEQEEVHNGNDDEEEEEFALSDESHNETLTLDVSGSVYEPSEG